MPHTLIHNGSLLDCTGRPLINRAAVLLDDNHIVAAGSLEEVNAPEGALKIDANGGFILPGFIDAHVHLSSEGYNLEKQLMTPFSFNFYKAMTYFRRTIEAGITSVRDAGGTDLGMKKACDEGLFLGPRVKISINALTITGGHGDSWMFSGADLTPFSVYPGFPDGRGDGREEVRKNVRALLRAGAEIIKIHSTGGVFSPTDRPEFTQFSPEELDVIVQEAHFHGGVKVMSHAQGTEGVKNAVLAGIHSIEHGIFLDDEVIDLMLQRGTFLVPTLLAPLSILESAEKGNTVPPHVLAKARDAYHAHTQSIARAHKAGVRIAMGTDAGVMPHGTNLRELGLLCKAGFSPMEAILATTRVAAECLEWQDRVGTIETGKLADIVIWKENPLENLSSIEKNDNALVVMKDGVVVKDIRKQN